MDIRLFLLEMDSVFGHWRGGKGRGSLERKKGKGLDPWTLLSERALVPGYWPVCNGVGPWYLDTGLYVMVSGPGTWILVCT